MIWVRLALVQLHAEKKSGQCHQMMRRLMHVQRQLLRVIMPIDRAA